MGINILCPRNPWMKSCGGHSCKDNDRPFVERLEKVTAATFLGIDEISSRQLVAEADGIT
jgi:hypothetical protein